MNRMALLFVTFWLVVHGTAFPAFARDAAEPVKVTIIDDMPEPDPARFASSAPTAGCGPSSLGVQEGESIVRKIAAEERFDPDLVIAVARQESGFRMDSVSSAGAIGLMQLMPDTATRFEVAICDPEDNVRGGIRYLRLLQKKYQNPIYVLAAYNAGEDAVEQNRGVPPYLETIRFVSAVLTDLYGWQPLPQTIAESRSHEPQRIKQSREDKLGSWTQGFVLHVEQ